jgi:hypothetical protein
MTHVQPVELVADIAIVGRLRVPEPSSSKDRTALVVFAGASASAEVAESHAERLADAGYVTLTVAARRDASTSVARLSALAAVDYLMASPSLGLHSVGVVELGCGMSFGDHAAATTRAQWPHPDSTTW